MFLRIKNIEKINNIIAKTIAVVVVIKLCGFTTCTMKLIDVTVNIKISIYFAILILILYHNIRMRHIIILTVYCTFHIHNDIMYGSYEE